MFVLYACHGIDKQGVDLGECPEGCVYGESYSNERIAAELYSGLASRKAYSFLPRPDYSSICRERFDKIATLGSVVVEIHTHEGIEGLGIAEGPIDPYCREIAKPVITFVCPFGDKLDGRHFQRLAYEIGQILQGRFPDLFIPKAVQPVSIPECKESKRVVKRFPKK
jgi:hypothetical protein